MGLMMGERGENPLEPLARVSCSKSGAVFSLGEKKTGMP
jgi:hypothetical protein